MPITNLQVITFNVVDLVLSNYSANIYKEICEQPRQGLSQIHHQGIKDILKIYSLANAESPSMLVKN